jgi:hypothetical protein
MALRKSFYYLTLPPVNNFFLRVSDVGRVGDGA